MPERASLTGGHCQQARSARLTSAMVLSRPCGAPGSARPDIGSNTAGSMLTAKNQPRRIAFPQCARQQRLLLDGRLLDIIESAEILHQVGVAFHLHAALVGTASAWCAFAVF